MGLRAAGAGPRRGSSVGGRRLPPMLVVHPSLSGGIPNIRWYGVEGDYNVMVRGWEGGLGFGGAPSAPEGCPMLPQTASPAGVRCAPLARPTQSN